MRRLRRLFVLSALLLLSPVTFAPGQEKKIDAKEELKKFTGKWNVVGNDTLEILIDGNVWDVIVRGRAGGRRDNRITIDPNKSPKEIDLKYGAGDQSRYGIYEFKEDGTLVICYGKSTASGRDASKRPTKFTNKPDLGSGDLLYVLEKPKKENEAPAKVIPGQEKKVDAKVELKKFQGKWNVVGNDTQEILIDGNVWDVIVRGRASGRRDNRITIDPNKSPKEIDLKYGAGDQSRYGIYEFKEDGTLVICYGKSTAEGRDASKRPTKFTTKPDIGSGDILYTLEKPKK